MILGFKTIFPKSDKPTFFPKKIMEGTKIHSIREGDRWKKGVQIHFATGVRTKNYNQFHFDFVKSVQKIAIYPFEKLVRINGKELSQHTISLLATNDGFDSIEDFWEWFRKPLTGQIIHFTDYKY